MDEKQLARWCNEYKAGFCLVKSHTSLWQTRQNQSGIKACRLDHSYNNEFGYGPTYMQSVCNNNF